MEFTARWYLSYPRRLLGNSDSTNYLGTNNTASASPNHRARALGWNEMSMRTSFWSTLKRSGPGQRRDRKVSTLS
jgi:hypothetical protein